MQGLQFICEHDVKVIIQISTIFVEKLQYVYRSEKKKRCYAIDKYKNIIYYLDIVTYENEILEILFIMMTKIIVMLDLHFFFCEEFYFNQKNPIIVYFK